MQGWLTKSLDIGDWTQSLSPAPPLWGWSWKFQPFKDLVFLDWAPQPRVISLWPKQSYRSGDSRGFKSSMPGIGDKVQLCIFPIGPQFFITAKRVVWCGASRECRCLTSSVSMVINGICFPHPVLGITLETLFSIVFLLFFSKIWHWFHCPRKMCF